MPDKKETESSAKAIAEALAKLSKEEDEAKEKGEKLKKTLEGIGDAAKELAEVAGIAFDAKSLIEFGKQAVETAEDFEEFTENIKSLAANSIAGSAHIGYLNDAITRLHLPMKEAYQGFEAIERGMAMAGISGKNMQQVFEGVAEAGAAMGLKPDEFKKVSDAVAAIGQSSKLSSTSLKDLMQVMPQAAQLAAESMHMSQEQLRQALEKGTISSGVFLQNFSGELKQHFEGGLAEAADGVAAKLNDVQTQFTQLMIGLGEDLKPVYLELLNGVVNIIGVLKSATNWMGQHKDMLLTLGKIVASVTAGFAAYNLIQGVKNKITAIGTVIQKWQAKALTETTGAAAGAAAATEKLAAAQTAETAEVTLATAGQWALNAAVDAFPGMLLITALTAVAGFAINAATKIHDVKENYAELHTLAAETKNIEEESTKAVADRTAKMEYLLKKVEWEKNIAEGHKNNDKIKKEYEEQSIEDWKLLVDLGGAFTKNLDKTHINIRQAISDMTDFKQAIKDAAWQTLAMNKIIKNNEDLLSEEGQISGTKEKIRQIASGPISNLSFIEAVGRLGFEQSEIRKYLINYEKNELSGILEPKGVKNGKNFDDGLDNLIKARISYINDKNDKQNNAILDAAQMHQSSLSHLPKDKQKEAKSDDLAGSGSFASNFGGNITSGTETSGATGNKSTTINIHIDKQIDKVEIHSTTIEGSTQKIKEALTRALAAAINDSQRLAHD